MRAVLVWCAVSCTACLVGVSSPVAAQTADVQALRQEIDQLRSELENLQRLYGERLAALEARLGAVADVPGAPPRQEPGQPPVAEVPPGAAGAGGPAGALPLYGAASAAGKIFNPDIAVIGDFLGAAGPNDVSPTPPLELHEAEASFQAIVDPYARGDFFFAYGSEGVEIEEGFVTFPTVPGGLLVKVGKTRAAFGKVNMFHNHQLPWTDRPLVTTNLVGGEEGISDAGISAARLIPNPWIFLEATGEVYRGDSALFAARTRSDLAYVGHLRGYHDFTESANIDFGASYARGLNTAGLAGDIEPGRFVTTLWGVDATVRWRPLQRAIYRGFLGRSEVIWSRRAQPDGLQPSVGYYASGDYQFARRWFAGFRYDRSDRAEDALLHDSGQSVTLTFWPSEFNQIRGQYRRTKYSEGSTANELLIQFQFSIGAHGAHPF
ncbi:MAG: hypothetical protein ACRD3C_15355 [Vicinamibacterales bacterium]